MRNSKIALVDDQPIVLTALEDLFRAIEGFDVVARGGAVRDALNIVREHAPDILVIDPTMLGDVFSAIAVIRSGWPETKVVAFSAAIGADYAVRALEAGASGYVLKKSSAQEVQAAVEAVLAGDTYISQGFASKVIAALRDESARKRAADMIKLSSREEQIVRLLLRGRTNKEIGVKLSLSEKTVKHYMSGLMQKLQARNRTEAVLAAQKIMVHQPDTAVDGGVRRYQ